MTVKELKEALNNMPDDADVEVYDCSENDDEGGFITHEIGIVSLDVDTISVRKRQIVTLVI